MVATPFELNLRHLRAMLAIREHGSITAAAEAVFLSQPALTQGIAKLERQLGSKLIERQTAGMRATSVGDMVSERVRAALSQLAAGTRGIARGFDHRARLMTMTQLRAFLALADHSNYAAAAQSTGLSQTAVHRAVGDLEQLIARELVERRGRRVFLNVAGRKLARGARLAVGEIAAILTELGLNPQGTLITIGALPLSRPFLVPEAMAKMTQEHPATRFKIYEGGWADLVEPLRDGVIDFAVGALPPGEIADLSQITIGEDRLVIVAGSHHPLARRATHSIEELSAYPWIVDAVNSPLRIQWERFFVGRVQPSCPIECGSVMIIGRLLSSGNFLTILSPDQVALQIRCGLLAQVGPPLVDSKRLVGVTTRVNWRASALQQRFIELLGVVAASRDALDSDQLRRVAGWI
jgi:DNA-binding transcriptional LysR family regulator